MTITVENAKTDAQMIRIVLMAHVNAPKQNLSAQTDAQISPMTHKTVESVEIAALKALLASTAHALVRHIATEINGMPAMEIA